MEQIKSAILIMDMQSSILSRLPDAATLVANVTKAIANARKQHIPVIYVVVGFRQEMPEISSNNKSFSAIKESIAKANMDEWMKVHPELTPQDGDIIITKRRISAFTGSDLEVVLRSQGIGHLILTGIATSGVVLSTLREASDKDYRLTVIADCCADADEEVHRVLTGKIFPKQADVITLNEWK